MPDSDRHTVTSFSNNAITLYSLGKDGAKGGSRLLTTVVEHFARDAGADLITLGLEDVDDLVQHFKPVDLSQKEEHISYDRGEAIVDLTQLSDDEDYSMPRKQARHEENPQKDEESPERDEESPEKDEESPEKEEESPEKEESPKKDVFLAVLQMFSMQRRSSSPSSQSSYSRQEAQHRLNLILKLKHWHHDFNLL